MSRYQSALDKLGGLKGIMRHLGDAPPGERWSSMKCPFCGKKSAAVFKAKGGDTELFKCHHDSCPTGGEAYNPIGYVGAKFNLATSNPGPGQPAPAYVRLMEMAQMWEEPRRSAPRPRASSPKPPAPASDESPAVPTPENESAMPDSPPPDSTSSDVAAPSSPNPDSSEVPTQGGDFISSEAPEGPALEPEDPNLFAADGTGPEEEEQVTSINDPAADAIRWFWESSVLEPQDEEALWKRRGLTPGTCRSFGLRSNRAPNLKLLEEAGAKFGVGACVAAGLWEGGAAEESGDWMDGERSRTSGARPSRFFHGYGISGYERRPGTEKKPLYDWVFPVIIPYFDFRLNRDLGKSSAAVVTEGEFKAMALYQVLDGRDFSPESKYVVALRPHKHWGKGSQPWFYMGPGGSEIAVGALPGITFAKREGETWRVRYLLDTWLKAFDIRDVVVAYDNQDRSGKGDSNSRYDAVVWGLWLARDLCRQGIRGRYAQIPDEERDEEGKADWDGVLAARVNGKPPEDWEKMEGRIRTQWRGWIRDSVDMRQDTPIQVRFDDKVLLMGHRSGRRWLELPARADGKLRRISYVHRLPVPGGESGQGKVNTRKISRRLMRIARQVAEEQKPHIGGEAAAAHLRRLGAAYIDIDGGYFACHPPKPKPGVKRPPEPFERDFWEMAMESSTAAGDVDGAWAAEMALKGIPERFSDFVVHPLYKLRTPANEFLRVITIKNKHGEETQAIELPGTDYATPTRLREFLNKHTVGAAWRAGERELQDAQEDWNASLAFRLVNQVCAWGWCAQAKAWFAADCAIDEQGIHMPNSLGYYKLKTGSFKVSEKDKEGRPFLQEAPRWEPTKSISVARIGKVMQEFVECMYLAVGSMHAHLSVGMIFAYAAAPEIFNAHHAFPGLWAHGEAAQGKTTLARWLMRLAGFKFEGKHGGVSLESSSGAGGAIVMQQFSNLPVWFEEAQGDTRQDLLRLLKDVFNRIGGAKALATGVREILTAPLVIGQATSGDHATRTRYPHVLMSAARRLPSAGMTWDKNELTEPAAKAIQEANYQKLEGMVDELFFAFRHVLCHRTAYAARVLEIMADWMASPEMRGIESRTAMVRGVALGGLVAAMESCGVKEWRHWTKVGEHAWESEIVQREDWVTMAFRPFLAQEARASVQEIREQGEIEEFLRAMITCFERGGFGDTKDDFRRYFNIRCEAYCNPPGMLPESIQRAQWTRVVLCINPDAVMDAIAEYLRKQGKTLKLRKEDLRSQMSARPWFVKPVSDGERVRFKVNGVSKASRFWAIDLDLLPEFGFRPCTDHEVTVGGSFDPRRGPLYAIGDALSAGQTEV